MPAWPDAAAVAGFLARAGRRRAWLAMMNGAAAGAVSGALVILMAPGAVGLTVAAIAIVLGAAALALSTRRAPGEVARSVERRAPDCRNIVITTTELMAAPDRVRPDVGARVCRDAAAAVSRLDVRRLYPARRSVLSLAGSIVALSMAIWAGQAGLTATTTAGQPAGDGSGAAGPAVVSVRAEIAPPAYSGRDTQTVEAPDELRALAGSIIRLVVQASATSISIETIDERTTLTRNASDEFETELSATADGFVTITPEGPDGAPGPPRLIGLIVEPDASPRVRITEPGQDLFLPDPSTQLALGLEADDDLGLASLALTYTKVSGSGENFNFVSGEIALDVTRASGSSWTGTGRLDLGALALEPGDVIVYRGVAADRRPGSVPVESDAFIVEIMSPGEAAASGFAIDDQRERYALSQRMVLIKTERLAARRSQTTPELVTEEAQMLAAEQRQVRAEFVFMMGGELSEFGENSDPFMLHEEDEAHAEGDIAAGRLVNQGRAELTRAIREMSRAATLLTSARLDEAIVAENAALEALQRAFSKSRYILRTLSERESIDMERRLSGTIDNVAGAALPGSPSANDEAGAALRGVLADVLSFAALAPPAQTASAATLLAQSVLRLDPSSVPLRQVAAALTDAARAIDAGDASDAGQHLATASTSLAAAARTTAGTAPELMDGARINRLRGARADQVRGGGRE